MCTKTVLIRGPFHKTLLTAHKTDFALQNNFLSLTMILTTWKVLTSWRGILSLYITEIVSSVLQQWTFGFWKQFI